MKRAIGQLLIFSFGIGEWIGPGFVASHALAPKRTRLVASILAVHGVADFLQVAYVAAAERRIPQPRDSAA